LSDIIDIEKEVKALVRSNPFSFRKSEVRVSEGCTILDIVRASNFPSYVDIIVTLNNEVIKKEDWATTFPHRTDIVMLRAVPSGGDSDSTMITVLTVIVLVIAYVVAPYVAAPLTPYIGGSLAFALAFGALSTLGLLALNSLVPPPSDMSPTNTYKSSNSYGISAARNSLNLYGVIPSVLGTVRIVPPYAALPYTESEGTKQVLFSSFLIQKGPCELSDFKIGETELTNIASEEELLYSFYYGNEETTYSDIIPGDVYPDSLSDLISNADGWVLHTTQLNTVAICVDLTFLRGLCEIEDDGSKSTRTVNLELQYSPTGEDDWVGVSGGGTYFESRNVEITPEWQSGGNVIGAPQYWQVYYTVVMNKLSGDINFVPSGFDQEPIVPSWAYGLAVIGWDLNNGGALDYNEDIRSSAVQSMGFQVTGGLLTFSPTTYTVYVASGTLAIDSDLSVTGHTSEAVFRTFSFPVVEGQYDVRIRRLTSDTTNDRVFDEVTWTTLKSYQAGESILETYIAHVDLKITATEKLNGVIDQFNCIATTICLDYDYEEETWALAPTNNPASLYRHVLQGPANKKAKADNEIDIDTLEAWHDRCRINGWEFNLYVDFKSSVEELLKMIASAGRASPGYIDGKHSVIMDKTQSNIAQHFTERNTWDYSYNKIFVNKAHAYRVRLQNEEKGYIEDEVIVYDDGYTSANATLFEELELPGITNVELAWAQARYFLAVVRLRPETHTFFCDAEQLDCTRGDRIKFNHKIISVGLGSGRVKSYTDDGTYVTSITVDEVWTMASGTSYGLRVRQMDGTSVSIELTTIEGSSSTVFVSSSLTIANAPDIGALCLFGEADEEAIDLIVNGIEPGHQLTAKLICLDYAPEVHDADQGETPEFDSHVTVPYDPTRVRPSAPAISSAESGIRVVEFSGNTVSYGIVVTLIPPSPPGVQIKRYHVRFREENTYTEWKIVYASSEDPIASINEVQVGSTYEVQARSESVYGMLSDWTSSETVTIEGDGIEAVTDIECTDTGNQTWASRDLDISWTEPEIITLSHVRLEFLNSGETAVLRSIEVPKKVDSFVNNYVYTYEQNVSDNSGAPSNSVKVRIAAVEMGSLDESVSSVVTFTNAAPATPDGLSSTPYMNGLAYQWNLGSERDLDHYEYRFQVESEGWGSWIENDKYDRRAFVFLTDSQAESYPSGADLYFEVKAVDTFGNESSAADDNDTTGSIYLPSTAISDIAQLSGAFTEIPVLVDDAWADDDPSAGYISWTEHKLYYNGTEYTIAAGNTNLAYVWWNNGDSSYSAAATEPSLDEGDFIIATNNSGTHTMAWTATANQVIGSAYIKNLSVLDQHVKYLSADKLISGVLESTNGNLSFDLDNAVLTVNQPEGLVIADGADITLEGNDSDPGKILFNGTSYSTIMGADTDGNRFILEPEADNVTQLMMGNGFYLGNRFSTAFMAARSNITLDLLDEDYGTQSASLEILQNDSYSRFRIDLRNHVAGDGGLQIDFYKLADGSEEIWPSSHKVLDVFTAAKAADDIYADDFQNVADIPYLDERRKTNGLIEHIDDLSVISSIRPSSEYDERTGFRIIDDNSLPDWFTTKNKKTKETLLDPDGKPYFALKSAIGLSFGAHRATDVFCQDLASAIEFLNIKIISLEEEIRNARK